MRTRTSRGFTLIELILVVLIFGVLGVLTIPSYLDESAQALMQAKWDKSGEVKSLHRELTETAADFPSVSRLAEQLPGSAGTPLADGIRLQIDGENYVIPTYRNTRCTELTTSVADTVSCVGTIPS